MEQAGMTLEEKLFVMAVRSPAVLVLRRSGGWYVRQNKAVARELCLTSSYDEGNYPSEAVLDHCRVLVKELEAGACLVMGKSDSLRLAYRRDACFWREIDEGTT